jgi:ribosomal protein S27AE
VGASQVGLLCCCRPPLLLPFICSRTESSCYVVGGSQNYTKPKKIKGKHKKYPLAVLKFYRVDDDGKITRLRKECPHEDCGAGVFMATHFDRHYCGKCGLTYQQTGGK